VTERIWFGQCTTNQKVLSVRYSDIIGPPKIKKIDYPSKIENMPNAIKTICLVLLTLLLINEPLMAQRGGRGGPTGPRIAPQDLPAEYGTDKIPDRETFEKLSYQGTEVYRDQYLADLEFVKFIIENFEAANTNVYFMNTEKYRAHPPWMRMVGIDSRCRGAITYLPRLTNPSGTAGLYIIDFQPSDSFSYEKINKIKDLLIEKMPFVKGKIAFHPLEGNVRQTKSEMEKYKEGGLAVHFDSDLYSNIAFLPLNSAKSFGLLREMKNAEARPSPRDIVIYKTLPNQMPRVAGVITEARQTPLSHVNLRAVQDKIPNAYVKNAVSDDRIKSLIGKLVSYEVTSQGFKIKEATKSDVDKHFASIRPTAAQIPPRDLGFKEIKPLKELKFENGNSFGVKSSNLAAMHQFKLPEGVVPDGYAIPFYFYDEFMKHNRFYDEVDRILNDKNLQEDRDALKNALSQLQKKVEAGTMPDWMMESLGHAQTKFPEGTSIRCRSSTNNEDLPGFSGAGLYDSFTHKPNEGHLSKSVKQVFASLWNFRAFEERAFYRIDHKATAMGVLMHPNFKNEQANGVAVTDDVLYESSGNYYLNTQIGEDLVTNPDAESSPEEVLLGWRKEYGDQVIRRSTASEKPLLGEAELDEMRKHLGRIHAKFAKLYKKTDRDQFAMEVEFKITEQGKVVIKQARPWVFQ